MFVISLRILFYKSDEAPFIQENFQGIFAVITIDARLLFPSSFFSI